MTPATTPCATPRTTPRATPRATPALDTGLELDWLERACRREVGYRRRVYGRLVAEGRKRQAEADRDLAQMEALVTLLAELGRPNACVMADIGGGRSLAVTADEFARWVQDPAAYAQAYEARFETTAQEAKDDAELQASLGRVMAERAR